MIVHLVSQADWESGPVDLYAPPSLEADGFIHCAGDESVALSVANAFYRDAARPFVAVELEERSLDAEVVWEAADPVPPPGVGPDVLFPHIYGPINRDAVVRIREVLWDDQGSAHGFR